MFVKICGEWLNMELVTRVYVKENYLVVDVVDRTIRYKYEDAARAQEGLEYLAEKGNAERPVRIKGVVDAMTHDV